MNTLETQRDRLQPTLFHRLSDDSPFSSHDSADRRVLSRAALRESVLESLICLFNAVRFDFSGHGHFPYVEESVLGYGLPPLAGQLASKIDVPMVEKLMTEAIRRFEPRVVAETLSVQGTTSAFAMNTQNVIEFEIRGQLRAQPVPIEVLLRTHIDLEGGHISVTDEG